MLMSTDLVRLAHAADYAARQHIAQRRKGPRAEPYVNHLTEVAALLAEATDGSDVALLMAGLLHDTLEDTDATYEDLLQRFGPDVASLVAEVTDDKSLPKEERKRLQIEHASAISHGAKLVKLADKICNLRDVADRPPAQWELTRRQEYFEWARQVIDGLRGASPRLEAAFDAAYALKPADKG
jgi:guanosine-3',5'-bis(diphosphate) 3'-pyrophosphohydrolase